MAAMRSTTVTPWPGRCTHRGRVACAHLARRLDGQVAAGATGGEEALDEVGHVEEAREDPARDARPAHDQHGLADLPALPDHRARAVDAREREVLPHRGDGPAQLGAPPGEVVGRVRVDGLVRAAVVLDVADRVAVHAGRREQHRPVDRALVDARAPALHPGPRVGAHHRDRDRLHPTRHASPIVPGPARTPRDQDDLAAGVAAFQLAVGVLHPLQRVGRGDGQLQLALGQQRGQLGEHLGRAPTALPSAFTPCSSTAAKSMIVSMRSGGTPSVERDVDVAVAEEGR